jgi:GT2 family glycosyltransferase
MVGFPPSEGRLPEWEVSPAPAATSGLIESASAPIASGTAPRIELTVIVAGLNRAESLRRTLASCDSVLGPKAQILYVDGGSTDGSIAVAESFPRVQVVRGDLSGVGQNRNRGALEAAGELLLFLDDDASLTADFVESAMLLFQSERTAAVAATLVAPSGGRNIHFRGNRTWGPWFLAVPLADGAPDGCPTLQVRGAAFVVRRTVFRQLGGFDDELYPYGGEEFDLCWRIWMHGYEVRQSSAEIPHDELGTRVTDSNSAQRIDRNLEQSLANYSLVYLKNGSLSTLFGQPFILTAVYSYAFRRGRPWAAVRALGLALVRVPIFLRRREEVQRSRRRSDLQIAGEFAGP